MQIPSEKREGEGGERESSEPQAQVFIPNRAEFIIF